MGQAGMSPSDSSVLPVGTTANNLSAMQAGVIDATVLAPPTTLKLKQLGFNQVADMADYGLIFYTSCLDAKKSWVDAHHDEAMNIVRGYLSGIAATFNDKQGTLATLAKYSQTTDQDILEGSYDTLIKVLPKVPTPKIAAVQTALSQSKQPAAKSANPASFIDTSFVDALEREGFIASLYKSRE
jgi:ABC-type nitrate/sulfonate/bicarbonate transport system substrate-binding protein